MSSALSSKEKTALFDQAKNYFATRTAATCCTYFLPRVKPDLHILDVGSGPGSITCDLAQLVPQGHVTGFDISTENINYARKLAASRDITNIHFIQGDARELPSYFSDVKFDIVHAHMVVMHLADPVAVIQQMRALLKPRGFLAVRDTIRHITYPAQTGPDRHEEAVNAVMRRGGGDPHGGLRNSSWVHEAGFAWENVRYGVAGGEVPREDKLLFVKTVRDTLGMIARGVESERSVDEIVKEWTEWWARWEDNEEARFVSLDGWVVALL